MQVPLEKPDELLNKLVQFYWHTVQKIHKTILFYADNGDLVTAVFILMVFYKGTFS